MPHCHDSCFEAESDAALLEILTGPSLGLPDRPARRHTLARRDAALDPLLLAAAAASGPHITRNHYAHDFFPGVTLPDTEGSWDWTKFKGEDSTVQNEPPRFKYVSRQAPRSVRMQRGEMEGDEKENSTPQQALEALDNLPQELVHRRPSRRLKSPVIQPTTIDGKPSVNNKGLLPDSPISPAVVTVKCMARTRIPTADGPVFLHIYHNNVDKKEHMAIVVDPAQFNENQDPLVPPIRSSSLDAVWNESETEMDRITRGAYVGKLSTSTQTPSKPHSQLYYSPVPSGIPPPLIRLHSECFTGEAIGSMRCDCGEQLEESIHQMFRPITIPATAHTPKTTIPGRGVVIYLRQEGRGIGLLEKIRAYNLQDLGHDTLTANLMLGHKDDERGYEIAAAILKDLGMGSATAEQGDGVRVLTNNPKKVEALESEGFKVVERVPMVPRSWQKRSSHLAIQHDVTVGVEGLHITEKKVVEDGLHGAGLIGGNVVHGEDLDKYLRTKVLKMGHMLPLWMEDPEAP